MVAAIESQETTDDPVCPHCEETLKEIYWRRIKAFLYEYVYLCPHCKKILGMGATTV